MTTVLDILQKLMAIAGIERSSPNVLAPDIEMVMLRYAIENAGQQLTMLPWPQLRRSLNITDGATSVALPANWNGVAGQVTVVRDGIASRYEPSEELFYEQALRTNYPMHRIAGSVLVLHPEARNTTAWYQSLNWLSTGSRITSNSDEVLLPEQVVLAGAVVRWLRNKGLPHQSELAEYMELLRGYLGDAVGAESA